ncbi:hypothetical protein Q9L58_000351 [Maublancomyces gigas]|uniref:Uncharacterized protein n=1 Tax=Discina gigas TaxID=1032678 RepID=A0ABR3GXQ7_9PEZI
MASSLFAPGKSHRLALKQKHHPHSQSKRLALQCQPYTAPLQRIEAFHDAAAFVPQFRAAPPVLTLPNVPATASVLIQQHLETLINSHENCPKGAKLDYNTATGSLSIISFPSWEHEHM